MYSIVIPWQEIAIHKESPVDRISHENIILPLELRKTIRKMAAIK
jgi:hypothetical protein